MSVGRVLRLAGRDLRAGPRSPVFVFVVVMPLLVTLLARFVLVSLLDPSPRLGLAAPGGSELVEAVSGMEGVTLLTAGGGELTAMLERGEVDVALFVGEGFEDSLRAGLRPLLDMRFSTAGHQSSRMLLAIAVMGLVREMEAGDEPPPVSVEVVTPEGEALPLSDRILPGILLFVLILTGTFGPAFMLVDEREHGTLQALLVTPVRLREVMAAKGLTGFAMTIVMAYATLLLSGISAAHPAALLACLVTAAFVCVGMGLVYGTLAPDAKSLYTLVKSLNILLVPPVVFYLFPDWPSWIARIFPTWWFMDPLYRVSLRGHGLEDVSGTLWVALLIGAALLASLLPLGRRMRRKLLSG